MKWITTNFFSLLIYYEYFTYRGMKTKYKIYMFIVFCYRCQTTIKQFLQTSRSHSPLGLFHYSCAATELRSKGEYANHTQQMSLERFITTHENSHYKEKKTQLENKRTTNVVIKLWNIMQVGLWIQLACLGIASY